MPIAEDRRGSAGVVCSLLQAEDGALRLVLDDVEHGPATSGSWLHKQFVTRKDYAGGLAELESMADSELAEFGHYVLTRLLACHAQYGTKS
jgi:hypothetical protein